MTNDENKTGECTTPRGYAPADGSKSSPMPADRDIVERLRDSQPVGTTGGHLLNDAADEINQLRGFVKTLMQRCYDEANRISIHCSDSAALWAAENLYHEANQVKAAMKHFLTDGMNRTTRAAFPNPLRVRNKLPPLVGTSNDCK